MHIAYVALTLAVGSALLAPSADGTRPSSDNQRGLRGKVIVIDPGHQLGNFTHPRKVNRLVNAGGFRKPCNSTGTTTNGEWPEATFNWRVAVALKRQLERRGATVKMTRNTNTYADWGPCIDVRGRRGNRVGADVVVSIHANGAASRNRGFFVIRPGQRRGWTGDIRRPSRRLAIKVKRGLRRAGAPVNNQYAPIQARTDLGTLNWSDVPIVMVELGNMRNRSDVRRMHAKRYRRTVYARGLRLGITRFLR